MANHLLKNIKALLLAGCFLDTPAGRRARVRGRRLLLRELREQVLDDGMHFERSPMYHCAMTADMLDLLAVLRADPDGAPAALETAAGRMCAFLRHTLHPDGRVAVFNDSVEHGQVDPVRVLDTADALLAHGTGDAAIPLFSDREGDSDAERVSGLLVHRAGALFAVFDGGLVGPDYQPGHAHCDTLSYEMAWNGARLITDTGVYHYRESPERKYARSTAAHNTVRIDGSEQSQVWKSFRVGRRARVPLLHRRSEAGCTVFQAAHDGYERFERGLVHERAMVLCGDAWVCVVDVLHGGGRRMIEDVVHFHPSVHVHRDASGIRATHQGRQLSIRPLTPLNVRMHDTEYYPAFGVRQVRTTAVFHGTLHLPLITGYVISLSGPIPSVSIDTDARTVRITHDGGTLHITSRL